MAMDTDGLQLSAELMVTVSAIKSLVAWIWTWVINDWIVSDGMLVVFLVVGAVNLAMYLTTFILFYRGKRIRAWLHGRDMMTRLGIN